MTWRDYEEQVAEFFRGLGWTVEVQASVQGVRTRHDVDVWALSKRAGVVIRWVVECKDWNSRVPKEKVLALRAIVDDVGADRGLLLNEAGFQSGAFQAAKLTNVTVTTLAELSQAAEADWLEVRLTAVHRRLADMRVRAGRLMVVRSKSKGSATMRTRRGMTDPAGLTSRIGVLSTTEDAVAQARAFQLPVVMPELDTESFVQVERVRDIIDRATAMVASFERGSPNRRMEWRRPEAGRSLDVHRPKNDCRSAVRFRS